MNNFDYYYYFGEVVEGILERDIDELDNLPTFYSVFGDYLSSSETEQTYWTSGHGKKLFEYVLNNHFYDFMLKTDKELENASDFKIACKEFVFRFYAVFRNTREYYDKIVDLYESQANNLLSKLTRETHTGTLFNDTPQNVDVEQFLGDDYATNATIGHGLEEYDNENVITRLKEIQENYLSAFADWASKFDDLFVSDLNYKRRDYYYDD